MFLDIIMVQPPALKRYWAMKNAGMSSNLDNGRKDHSSLLQSNQSRWGIHDNHENNYGDKHTYCKGKNCHHQISTWSNDKRIVELSKKEHENKHKKSDYPKRY